MGLFVGQKDTRSELQERIANDLREKAKASAVKDAEIDGSKDIKYLEGTKQTTTLAWAWMIVFFMAIGVVVLFLMQGR